MLRGVVVLALLGGCSLYFGDDEPSDGGGGGGGTAAGTCAAGYLGSRWIVFDSDDSQFNRDVYRMRPDGTNVERLTTGNSIEQEPAPSPDGHTLAFSSNRSGTFQIYLLNLATNAVTQLTHHAGDAVEPSYSHNGTLIAFRSDTRVYTIHVDGTNEALVAESTWGSFNAYFRPTFSMDDTELLVDRNNEIKAFRLDGGGERYIVNNWTSTIKSPSPSPAGTAIAYETFCTGAEIWATPFQVATNPCEGRRLTPVESSTAHHPAWGPDDVVAYERVDDTNHATIALIATAPNSAPCNAGSAPYDRRNPAWLVTP